MLNECEPINIVKLKESLWGDQALFIEIAKAMCDDIASRGVKLNQAFVQRDAVVAKQEAHALRGGLLSIKADVAAALAAELEGMVRAVHWDGFGERLKLFETENLRIKELLEQELKKTPVAAL